MVFWPVPGVFRKRERWFFSQVFSIGPLKRFWGVAMSDFDFTPLSIHPNMMERTHIPGRPCSSSSGGNVQLGGGWWLEKGINWQLIISVSAAGRL